MKSPASLIFTLWLLYCQNPDLGNPCDSNSKEFQSTILESLLFGEKAGELELLRVARGEKTITCPYTRRETSTKTSAPSATSSNSTETSTAVICQNRGFCYLFNSAITYDGGPTTPTGFPGMDARCNADANKPTTSNFKAMLVGPGRIASVTANVGDGQVDWVLYPSMTYRRPDNQPIAVTNAAKLLLFPLTNAISLSGVAATWTGMNVDWTTNGDNCTGWSTTGGFGSTGLFTSTTTSALYSINAQGCNASTIFHIYCAEQ